HYLYFFFPAYPDPRHLHSSLHDALPILPMDLLTRREFMARTEAVRQVHYPASAARLDRAKERLAFEEMFVLQVAAQLAKRARQARSAQVVPFDEPTARGFVAALPFKLTKAQRVAAWQILQD